MMTESESELMQLHAIRINGHQERLLREKEGFYPELLKERGPEHNVVLDYSLQKSERVNVCSYESPSWWYFLPQPQEANMSVGQIRMSVKLCIFPRRYTFGQVLFPGSHYGLMHHDVLFLIYFYHRYFTLAIVSPKKSIKEKEPKKQREII